MNTTLPPSGPRAYRVERFVGRGGFGCVYVAQNLAEGALGKVALKVMDEGAAEEWVARFFHEAQVLSRLSGYPAFVQVNAVFKMERRFCIDMEYVQGLSLDELLERGGPLPLAAALQITRTVASALDAAYNRARGEDGQLLRVLHRDLKPGNLRVGVGGTVKVLDFGLARSELRGVRPETLRALPATLAYMAPERYQFRASFGHAADLYALGMTLYELLAGVHFLDTAVINPCLEADREEIEGWTRTRLEQLRTRRELPDELVDLLAAMLRFDPEARIGGAEIDRACRQIGGLEMEDRYREWVEGPFQRLVEIQPRVPRVDPWAWVGTVRRSDQERRAPSSSADRAIAAAETIAPEDPSDREATRLEAGPTVPPWTPQAPLALSSPAPAPPHTSRAPLWIASLVAVGVALAWGLWPRETWTLYVDGDGDGYGAGAGILSESHERPGHVARAGDCDDQRAAAHPDALESCDGTDEDCDGQADQGLARHTWYVDGDGDGLGGEAVEGCHAEAPAGQVAQGGDCDDQDPSNACARGRSTTGSSGAPTSPKAPTDPTSAATSESAAPPVKSAPQGMVFMEGAEATLVRLRGLESVTLHPGEKRAIKVGSYAATVEFDGGDYELQVVVSEGATTTFDCTARRMGSPCRVR